MAKKTSPVNKTIKKNSSKAKGAKTSLRKHTNGKLKAASNPSPKKTSRKTTTSESISLKQQLAQREAELSLINSIQQGLAAELDFQAIVDLVGDKLRDVFNTPNLNITWYDEKANLIHYLYIYEYEKRKGVDPQPPRPGGIFETLVTTRQPMVLNTVEDLAKLNAITPLPGTEVAKSSIEVPIISSDRVLGGIGIDNFERENAFGESEVRLLTTIAASLGTALENARLFDETQHLLKETEQSNAELAIINSVQEGLARKLDFRGIVDLVGEKLGEIFKADTIDMGMYAAERDWTTNPYYVDRGQRVPLADSPTPRPSLAARMLDTRKPLLIDTREEGIRLGSLQIPIGGADIDKNESYLGVPILTGDKVIGWMAVQSYQQIAYDQDDLRLLQTLANSMSVALENARLFDETQRLLKETEQRAAELQIINSVQEGLARKLDLQEIVDLVGEKIGEIFAADTVSVGMYDAERDWSVNLYYVDRGQRIPLGDGPTPRPGLTAIIVDTREPLLIGTIEEGQKLGARRIPRIGEEEDKNESYLGVPIMVREKVIGVSAVQSYKQNAFNQNDLRLLQTLANSMSVALENARLFDETQRLLKETEERNAELAIINRVQEGLASKLEIRAIYELIGEKVREIFHADTTYINTYNKAEQSVYSQYYADKGQRIVRTDPLPFGEGLYTRVIQTRQPILAGTRQEQLELGVTLASSPNSEQDLNQSYLGVPILAGGEVTGVVSVQAYEPHAFGENDVRLLQTLANSMSVALENARLFDETQRLLKETEQRAAELATINTVSTALAGELDLNALIGLVGEQIRNTFSADIAYVALLDEEASTIRFPYTYGEEFTPLPYGQGLTSKIIDTAKPLLINQDIEKRRAELGARQVGIRARSYLGVPIFLSGKAIGVISVQSTEQENMFTESDQGLLGTIAANVGVALQNAHLFDELQTRNREISESLEQQTATSEILQAIASSPTEIQPVLDVIARNAVQLSGSNDALIDIVDQGILRVAAHYGNIPIFPIGEGIPLNRDSVSGRAIIDGRTLQAIHKQPGEESEYPEGDKWAQTYGYQMTCSVPLLREGKAIGVIIIRRRKPHLFNGKQIALIETFASQAVIAIENVRLFNELQTRNREITEALEQQTATSEILSIIAENPTDVQPVLDSVAERAARLCNSYDAVIARVDGNSYRIAAHWGPMPIPVEILNNGVPLDRDTVTGRAMVDRKTVHIHDLLAEPAGEFELSKGFYETSKQRTMLVTPLMRENEVIGAIMIRRREVNPFTDKQVALLKIFADQAAIAIENVRLFDEVTRRKEYFEALFQNNPVAVVTTDIDAIVTSWNPAAEKLFGYTREEVIGKNVDDLVANHEDLHAQAVRYSRGLNPGGNAFRAVVKRTRKDGSLVDVELSAVPIIVHGKKQGSYALYHDITELLRARQEAIAANEAKSSFLATMSHEIRTPMNAVIGMSGLLMDTDLNKEQRDYAETIRNSGDALLAIINDILDFSKIEANKMDVEFQPFDLRECVESALDLTAARAIEKGLDIAYIIDEDVPAGIKSDMTRLRQILINLLSNAIKFTEKGEVVLTVRKGKAPNELLFMVRDTGIGISENHMSRLFQSFSQADSSTTRKFGGTGLGLAISKRLAEMLGGEMHAESGGIGKGSAFIFTIKAEPAKIPERKTERDIKGIQSVLHDKRVLIVDDNATNRRILMLQTEKWGMSPRETEHPQEALEWLKTGEPFELAILDLQMPEMDGFMLTREIRKMWDEKSLPIILLASLGRREIDADDLEFAAYLTKPLKPSALYDALAGIFARNIISPKVDSAVSSQREKSMMDAELGRKHPLRILLAEDNAVNQKLALRILEQMGYRADVASNGIEAVESIQRQTYDVILMDVQMPDMDGLDATREIRKLANAIQPHIVAMTANALEGDREMCLAAGMNDYISKPIRVNELVEALMKARRK